MRIPSAVLLTSLLPFIVVGQESRSAPVSGNLDYDGRFTFTRIRYSSGWNWGGGSWAHDYPRADLHLPRILDDLTNMRPRLDGSNVYELDDPEIFLNPVI
jgi:hypothetical protein